MYAPSPILQLHHSEIMGYLQNQQFISYSYTTQNNFTLSMLRGILWQHNLDISSGNCVACRGGDLVLFKQRMFARR